MKKIIYTFLSKVVRIIFKENVTTKQISGLDKKLYYERSQHMKFLFQRKIRYEEHLQLKIANFIKEGDLIFDIGANIGQYAVLFSELVGKEGKVVSFEPDYKNFAFLQFNVNINKCNNVKCSPFGVGRSNSEMTFFRDTTTGGRKGSFKKEFVGANFKGFQDTVLVKSFDAVIAEFGKPNFVKIDVEGFEDDVVSALTTKLDDCIFFIEVRKSTKKKVFDYFKSSGYECICIDGEDVIIYEVSEIPDFANLLFAKKIALRYNSRDGSKNLKSDEISLNETS